MAQRPKIPWTSRSPQFTQEVRGALALYGPDGNVVGAIDAEAMPALAES